MSSCVRAHVCVCLCEGRRTPLVQCHILVFWCVAETLLSQKKLKCEKVDFRNKTDMAYP